MPTSTTMFTNTFFRLLLAGICLLSSGLLSGQSIFSNPITDSDPSTANPYTNGQSVNANITVSGIGRGPGITANSGGNRYNASSWNTTSIDLTAYFTFTLSPGTGKKISFSSFSFTPQASSTGPTQYAIRTSLNNFASDVANPTVANSGNPDALETVSLSAASFQNITTPITFRIYGWGTTSATGTFSINDFDFSGAVALPIELIRFYARIMESREIRLSFSTATERNNNYFSIERSSDGMRFESIGQVDGAGNSTTQQDYTFTDEHPLKGLNFYRLKQVDYDGQFSYSPVVTVTFGQTGGIRLAPQPVSDQLQVTLEHATEQESQWQVYDFSGRLIQSGTLEAEASDFRVQTSTFTEGTYVLRVVSGQSVMTQQFQKR